jgi:hypothetical protein
MQSHRRVRTPRPRRMTSKKPKTSSLAPRACAALSIQPPIFQVGQALSGVPQRTRAPSAGVRASASQNMVDETAEPVRCVAADASPTEVAYLSGLGIMRPSRTSCVIALLPRPPNRRYRNAWATHAPRIWGIGLFWGIGLSLTLAIIAAPKSSTAKLSPTRSRQFQAIICFPSFGSVRNGLLRSICPWGRAF